MNEQAAGNTLKRKNKMKEKKNPDKCFEGIEGISILFNNETTSHRNVICQFVDKLEEAGFAPREEIIENLRMIDIMVKE